jgi:hypothetical protein
MEKHKKFLKLHKFQAKLPIARRGAERGALNKLPQRLQRYQDFRLLYRKLSVHHVLSRKLQQFRENDHYREPFKIFTINYPTGRDQIPVQPSGIFDTRGS